MSASRTPSRAQAQAEARRLVGEHIERLAPYPPGKPIEELERELGITGSIKLASNENPLGPSPRAVEAVARALGELHRYPDGSAYYLKQRLAAHLGVAPEELIIGNGSNEIIELLIKTFVGPEDEILFAEQSFAIYPIAAQSAGARWMAVPLRDYTHDLDAMADRISTRTKLVFIANPNNPTGTIVRREAFERFLARVPDGVIVGLDEAYFEYVTDPEYPNGLRYRDRVPLLVVLRTFSKIYGLAGLRIGYGVGPRSLVQYLERVRQPFNVNSLAQVGAVAALDDAEHVARSQRVNREGLEYLSREVVRLGLTYVPSQANFLLIHLKRDGQALYEALLRQGVIVRPMRGYGLPETIRVTVGTPEENRRFIRALETVLSPK